MKKTIILMLALHGISVIFSSTVLASEILVPDGDFAIYKPGTGYTISATLDESSLIKDFGDNGAVLGGGGTVTYGDGTSGTTADVPAWITPVISQGSPSGNAQIVDGTGYDETDGTHALNVFGAWSGQTGNLAQSAVPLNLTVRGDHIYTLSAMFKGDPQPITFDLLVDGVRLDPDSSVDPVNVGEAWRELSRTYNSMPDGDVTILVGTSRPADGAPALTGGRLQIDNIALNLFEETVSSPLPLVAAPVPTSPLWLLGIMAGLLSLLSIRKLRKA